MQRIALDTRMQRAIEFTPRYLAPRCAPLLSLGPRAVQYYSLYSYSTVMVILIYTLTTVLQPNPLFSEPWRLFPRREGAKKGETVVSQLA